jgi:hypothetical protein
MRIWGYWATLGWAFLAFLVGQFAALVVLLWLRIGDLNSLLATPFDGVSVTLFIVIANPIMIAVIALAVWLAGNPQADYLALRLPHAGSLTVGILWLAGLIAIGDGLLYVSGAR